MTSYEGELTIKASADDSYGVGARLQVPLGAELMVDERRRS